MPFMPLAEARERITALMGWETYRPDNEGIKIMTKAESNESIVTATADGKAVAAPLVYGAWASVMADIAAIAKGERAQAGRTSFSFRGVDSVMQAVGPVLRHHQVSVVPRVLNIVRDEHESKSGGRMVDTVVQVEFNIYATDGSSIVGSAYGEAADAGDKSVPKAMSVAFRTFLLQSLCIPTDEPDPDTHIYERASKAEPPAKPEGPPITPEQRSEIEALFDTLVLDEEARARGIRSYTGRPTDLADLTEHEAEQVLVPLRRTAQARQAAPTQEDAEALVGRALGATPVEEEG